MEMLQRFLILDTDKSVLSDPVPSINKLNYE